MGKSCFFIGHRDAPPEAAPLLEAVVLRHIEEYGVTAFTVGRYGRFDSMAAQAVVGAKAHHPQVRLYLLWPYHPAQRSVELPAGFDKIYYPFEQAEHPRTAIAKANRCVIRESDFLIAYVQYAGNARTLLQYAREREKKQLIRIENLADHGLLPVR